MTRPTTTAQPPTSRVIRVDGLDLRVLEWGMRGRPAVLLLHGLRSYAHTWARLAGALHDTHHVVALDFRGRGGSSWDPRRRYFTETYVCDVEGVVAALALGRFSLVGHSMGGTVGYVYAARHPDQVDGLVVEDIGPGSSTDSPGARRILREVAQPPSDFDSLADVEAYWRALRPDVPAAALASRIEHTVRRDPDGRWRWTLDMAGIAAARRTGDPAGSIDLWACVEALSCRTLVLRGADSDFLSVDVCRELAARQPLLRWVEIPGAGHYAHDDNPDAVTAQVRAFLDGGTA